MAAPIVTIAAAAGKAPHAASEAMQMGCEVYHALKGLIKAKYGEGRAAARPGQTGLA